MPFFVIKKGLVLLEWKYFPTPKILDPDFSQSEREPNQAKRNSDFVRYHKRLEESLFNNFPQNNVLVHWFTGTYADQRVKSINTAKRDFKKFVYSFGNAIKAYTAVVELDINHHPHVHAMLLTSIILRINI
ncbi:hypothetical protein [Lactiplantibacillus plantarum]|jgi:hypothetical protein|uniref:hypothetical protein n=1 Tax=Lactiplantibacillus plantarum TaxID=1590 RepID=UPI0007C654E7|nr:hypothetical protein [Lactiplantibacillus plantarum]MCW6152423.1 hypothetical protein [Lactiplantibacillus plantarum]